MLTTGIRIELSSIDYDPKMFLKKHVLKNIAKGEHLQSDVYYNDKLRNYSIKLESTLKEKRNLESLTEYQWKERLEKDRVESVISNEESIKRTINEISKIDGMKRKIWDICINKSELESAGKDAINELERYKNVLEGRIDKMYRSSLNEWKAMDVQMYKEFIFDSIDRDIKHYEDTLKGSNTDLESVKELNSKLFHVLNLIFGDNEE